MIFSNTPVQNKTNFTGYDARKLKGFVMNSNFAGIADEMKKIGEIENFKLFLFERTPFNIQLKTDTFKLSDNHKGCWIQDSFGIVKNSLLAYENIEKTDILKKAFNLKPNKFQTDIHNDMNVPQMQEYIDLLYNLPIAIKDGKQVVKLNTPDGVSYIDKKVFDAEFNINSQILKNVYNRTHVPGGNYFLTKNKDGTEELLVGQNELKKFSIDQLKQMFMTDKIHIIPQADFHIDLFLRPLKDKKVLIADDEMMVKTMQEGANKILEQANKTNGKQRELFREPFVRTASYAMEFKNLLDKNPYAGMKEVEEALIKAGYEPIHVPARFFNILENMDYENTQYLLTHYHNYMNANTHINDKGELIYITNKSTLDDKLAITEQIEEKTGFSLKKAFLEAIKPYVDKTYFITGKNNTLPNSLLPEYNGGIHCMCMEVPE